MGAILGLYFSNDLKRVGNCIAVNNLCFSVMHFHTVSIQFSLEVRYAPPKMPLDAVQGHLAFQNVTSL